MTLLPSTNFLCSSDVASRSLVLVPFCMENVSHFEPFTFPLPLCTPRTKTRRWVGRSDADGGRGRCGGLRSEDLLHLQLQLYPCTRLFASILWAPLAMKLDQYDDVVKPRTRTIDHVVTVRDTSCVAAKPSHEETVFFTSAASVYLTRSKQLCQLHRFLSFIGCANILERSLVA